MKKSLLFLLLLLALTCNAQERVNKEKLVFKESSEKLTKAIGWYYNSYSGEWISNNNVLYDKKIDPNQNQLISSQSQNFISIQSKTTVYNGETYYFIIIEKGNIRFSTSYKETLAYLTSAEEYSKLLSITGNVSKIKCFYVAKNGSSESTYNESDFLIAIRNKLDSKNYYNDSYFYVKLDNNNNEVVRFLLPKDPDRYGCTDFDNNYFETTKENFNKIIIAGFNKPIFVPHATMYNEVENNSTKNNSEVTSVNYAQDGVKFEVVCKRNVVLGEQFNVSYILEGNGSNFEMPNFNDFEVVGGPFSSSSSSVQIINGSVVKATTTTYSVCLRALKEGSLTIPAATITVNRKKIKSPTMGITVVAGGGNTTYSSSSKSGYSNNSQNAEIFLEAIPSKETVCVGEQIVLTYKIYYTVSISQLFISKAPSYSGFLTKDITDNNCTLQQSPTMKNGKQYAVATVQEIALTPTKSGILTIDPMEISCIAQIRTQKSKQSTNDPFEDFFGDIMGSSYTNVKKEIKSQPISIEVKPKPNNK